MMLCHISDCAAVGASVCAAVGALVGAAATLLPKKVDLHREMKIEYVTVNYFGF